MFGIFLDVTGRKQAEEGNELLAGEMSHRVGEQTASTLAMVVHELATNSVKYGALSCSEGSLSLSTRTSGNQIDLIWAETGGPRITEPPKLTGFGSRLIARTVSSQLGGDLAYDWQESGLVVTIHMQQDRMAA